MTSQLSRVQIVDAPPELPGKCAVCGTTQGPMIDFGMFMEFYGYVYFCVESCMVEIANAFDYHSPRQWKMMMNQVEDQRNEINELRDQNEQLRVAVDSLAPLASLHLIDSVPELDVDEVLKEPESEPEQLSFDFDGESERGEAGEEGSTQQNDEPRPSYLRDDLSIDDFLADI